MTPLSRNIRERDILPFPVLARLRKNVRPQCNATFMATALSSFQKNEVGNAFLTLIFLLICHTFRTFFLNLAYCNIRII